MSSQPTVNTGNQAITVTGTNGSIVISETNGISITGLKGSISITQSNDKIQISINNGTTTETVTSTLPASSVNQMIKVLILIHNLIKLQQQLSQSSSTQIPPSTVNTTNESLYFINDRELPNIIKTLQKYVASLPTPNTTTTGATQPQPEDNCTYGEIPGLDC